MSFQWIINNAVDVSINKRGVVAQTMSRDQTVRAVSRGGRIWRFTVTPSPGLIWQDVRSYIETLDKNDRFTTATINFDRAEFDYIFGYQGGQVSTTGWTATATQGSATITVGGGTLTSGYRYKSGDIIQMGASGKVYSIVGDVAYNATTATLNRPVLEASNTYNLTVGRACTWTVICTEMPTYKITPNRLIEWSGPFTFVEALV